MNFLLTATLQNEYKFQQNTVPNLQTCKLVTCMTKLAILKQEKDTTLNGVGQWLR